MFYFLWHTPEKRGPYDVTKILAADPKAMMEPLSPLWGPLDWPHYWGEPQFGYYLGDDPWVLRKHAQMLSDAGVDVIIFDTSNFETYPHNYGALCEVYRKMRHEGNRTPQIAFLTPFGDPKTTVQKLYDELYSKHLYEELWFQWDGKALILANPAQVNPALRTVFTFRRPQADYFAGPTEPGMWSWLEVYPQHVFTDPNGHPEQMSIGVAQNAVNGRLGSMSEHGSLGRSFHDGHPATQPSDVLYGYNFAEQWQQALKLDPKAVFVTGWNEWIAGRFDRFNHVREPVMFVDEFDQEHSRDIEPMKDGHGDNYYYQLVSCIRKFKGARPLPAVSVEKSIRIDGDFSQWADVRPEYQDDLFDTDHRKHAGVGKTGPYLNNSGRNDLDTMKVSRDSSNLYFYVKTRGAMTPPEGESWMLLMIDSDCNHATGWEGYDFLIDRSRSTPGTCSIERNIGGWHWEKIGVASMRQTGDEMQIVVPRRALGLDKEPLRFDFKWADNLPATPKAADFLDQGDVAPNGRLNYRYQP
jgi:hypothetical protein